MVKHNGHIFVTVSIEQDTDLRLEELRTMAVKELGLRRVSVSQIVRAAVQRYIESVQRGDRGQEAAFLERHRAR